MATICWQLSLTLERRMQRRIGDMWTGRTAPDFALTLPPFPHPLAIRTTQDICAPYIALATLALPGVE
jgi:hypothetical protein